ncbi:MAG: aspartyl protease family protein [Candidatus Beckwithbacteria bacterium]|nr:aspartyl protease family protein [Candidatus Beckwithbacteria bacterium]
MEENARWKLIAVFKLVIVVLLFVVTGLFLFNWQKKSKLTTAKIGFAGLIGQTNGAILTIPYQQTLYKYFGATIDPKVTLPVKTIYGYKDFEFLIDSGAVVSALPQTLASDLGVSLEELPRITIEGFAGQKTFAYRGEFVIKIGKEEVVIPVVFSENPNSSNILGRIGFFEQFNVNFDANNQTIIITKKGS